MPSLSTYYGKGVIPRLGRGDVESSETDVKGYMLLLEHCFFPRPFRPHRKNLCMHGSMVVFYSQKPYIRSRVAVGSGFVVYPANNKPPPVTNPFGHSFFPIRVPPSIPFPIDTPDFETYARMHARILPTI